MFSLVSIEDVVANLRGLDILQGLFEWYHSKGTPKVAITRKVSRDQSTLPLVQNIWVFPCHLLLATEGTQELLAFDQLPKVFAYSACENLLLPSNSFNKSVLDVIRDSSEVETFFIVTKVGEVIVWRFEKPACEWRHVTIFSVCKGKGTQLVDVAYDDETRSLLWCEKRSASQCCIVQGFIVFAENQIHLSKAKAVLHNCLPMSIHYVAVATFCLKPVSNSPPGLLLFWSASDDVMKVFVWSEDSSSETPELTTSDFQTIVTNHISLWINNPSSESKLLCIATHPNTHELVILQNDLQVFCLYIKDRRRFEHVRLCSLEVENAEVFSKQVQHLYPFRRQAFVLMTEGEVNVFDIKSGTFLWKVDSFKAKSPRIWMQPGAYPSLGVWNRNGIWVFREEPISDSIKHMYRFKSVGKEAASDTSAGPLYCDGLDPTLGVYSEKDKSSDAKRNVMMKKLQSWTGPDEGHNRDTNAPIALIIQILNNWRLNNMVTDFTLTVSERMRSSLAGDEVPLPVVESEIALLIEAIKDAGLLLVLFGYKNLSPRLRRLLVAKLRQLVGLNNGRHLPQDCLDLLTEFLRLEDEKDIMLSFDPKNIQCKGISSDLVLFKREIEFLEQMCAHVAPDLGSIERLLIEILCESEVQGLDQLLLALLSKDAVDEVIDALPLWDNRELVNLVLWKTVVCRNATYEMVCSQMWRHYPGLLPEFLSQAKYYLSHHIEDDVALPFHELIGTAKNLFVRKQHSRGEAVTRIVKDQALAYKAILQMDDRQENWEGCACQVLLESGLIDEALVILKGTSKSSHIHKSLFFGILRHLIAVRELDSYGAILTQEIPEKFGVFEFLNIVQDSLMEVGGSKVFVSSDRELCVGTIAPFLHDLIKERVSEIS